MTKSCDASSSNSPSATAAGAASHLSTAHPVDSHTKPENDDRVPAVALIHGSDVRTVTYHTQA